MSRGNVKDARAALGHLCSGQKRRDGVIQMKKISALASFGHGKSFPGARGPDDVRQEHSRFVPRTVDERETQDGDGKAPASGRRLQDPLGRPLGMGIGGKRMRRLSFLKRRWTIPVHLAGARKNHAGRQTRGDDRSGPDSRPHGVDAHEIFIAPFRDPRQMEDNAGTRRADCGGGEAAVQDRTDVISHTQ